MDRLLQLSGSPLAKKIIRGLGLPVGLPPRLQRAAGAWDARLLTDRSVAVYGPNPSAVTDVLAQVLAPSGARVVFVSSGAAPEAFRKAAEGWAEPCVARSSPLPGDRLHALVADLTSLASLAELDELYDFFHAWIGTLTPSGRVVLLVPDGDADAERRAAWRAAEGFTRSLAKELGRKGTTANLIRLLPGAESQLAGPLRYFLAANSAFVTAQPLTLHDSGPSAVAQSLSARPLEGKLALVTGAAQGIGLETAKVLHREGAELVLLDHPASETASSLAARELGASLLLADLQSEEANERICQHGQERGGFDIVVHNAGVTRDKTLARMTREQWSLVLDVNLRAVVRNTQALLSLGLIRDGGRLVLLSSVGGIAGNPGQTNYGASKAGLLGYVAGLAGTLDRGVTINAVAPGLIETKMTARMPLAIREAGRRLTALNQGGLPRDVAEAIAFLSMPWAGGINGQTLRVCGGALIGA